MSGLLALLDDVAAIAKVAAASVDDVAAQAAKASAKAAGAVIDDAAVTPRYVHGFSADRELPIIWRIARGSVINKLVFLLPAGLLLTSFAPWAIGPLLMLGGAYLCFEGAEKLLHALHRHEDHDGPDDSHGTGDPAHLEQEKVAGAIKTDFILSAEIMTIALAAIPPGTIWMTAATLAAVAVMITFAVYGSVALIVKLDDIGLYAAKNGRLSLTRALGRGLVHAMPGLMVLLSTVGTAAMLWVGGAIIIHGLAGLGWHVPEDLIHHWAQNAAHLLPGWHGLAEWMLTATASGLVGLGLGLALVPVGVKVIGPLWATVFRR